MLLFIFSLPPISIAGLTLFSGNVYGNDELPELFSRQLAAEIPSSREAVFSHLLAQLAKEALVLNPDPARTHFYLGQVFELKGEKDKALKHYREALRRVLDEPVRE